MDSQPRRKASGSSVCVCVWSSLRVFREGRSIVMQAQSNAVSMPSPLLLRGGGDGGGVMVGELVGPCRGALHADQLWALVMSHTVMSQ